MGDHGGIAREAAARQEWADVYAAYCEADPTDLGPEDLEAFADAAWWTSRLEESLDLRARPLPHIGMRVHTDAQDTAPGSSRTTTSSRMSGPTRPAG